MQGTRLNLGTAPTLQIESCGGDVEIRGSANPEVVIDNDGREFSAKAEGDRATVGVIEGNCAIRAPEGSHVRIATVGGQLRVKGVLGSVEIETVAGDCAARRVGGLSIGSVGGDFQMKRAAAEISLGRVGGDVTLRHCDGPVRIESAGGDVSAHAVTHGLQLDGAGGDVDLRSDITPESTYRLRASGDVMVRIPENSDARFSIAAQGGVRLDSSLQANQDGDRVTATLGSGSTAIEVEANGDVRVRLEENCDCEDDVDVSFTTDIDHYMVDVSAQLDNHMRKLESRLNDLPEIVRRRVERKLDEARRRVDSAERQARRAAEKSGRMGGVFPVTGGHNAAISEPVSEQERLAILKMLEDGKINVAEAQQLLTALEDGT